MIETLEEELEGPAPSRELVALRTKIGWICHSVRIAAVLYPVWLLYLLLTFWTDKEALNRQWGHLLNKDLLGISSWQMTAALGVQLVTWLFASAACYFAWRLFTAYLSGNILTAESSAWLGRVAWFGLAAEGIDILSRPLIAILVTLHFPAGLHQRAVAVYFQAEDLLILFMLLAILALASVQKTAAIIAEEHRQMV
jgi:hypothetical protein